MRAYWWWLNGNVSKASITRDLEGMAAKGFGGALICDAGGATQDGNDAVPAGPMFASPAWCELYLHTLAEAKRLQLEMSLNIQSGWNLGGPGVPASDAPKKLVWSATRVQGPARVSLKLAEPKHPAAYYEEVAVVACPVLAPAGKHPGLQAWQDKALAKPLSFSAPATAHLMQEPADRPDESYPSAAMIQNNLRSRMLADGTLQWDVPAGEWEILRIGATLNDHCQVSTSSGKWVGYAIDPFDAGAFRRYWDGVVEPLLKQSEAFCGTTLKYLHTDSWEVEVANWTPTLREEFKTRRGYDLEPYLPCLTGRVVGTRSETNRFLHDLRRTMGDLAIEHHYRLFRDGAARHHLLIHPESGGPHAVPIDSLQCLGFTDAPMSEFWASSWRHRVGDANRYFVKQPASAAHTYGHPLVLAEGFTTIGPHWQETLWDNLKPSFDRALCEGLNRLVWHAFVSSPAEMGMPGQQYFAGTHLNPNVTWWSKSAPFFSYINRCQFLLQQGTFVADALYYYGNHVPNFTQLKASDPAGVLPGYDYDVATEEVILNRLKVANGLLVLPDGMSYRLLVMPDLPSISLPVLRKVNALVQAGATVVGNPPGSLAGLEGGAASESELRQLCQVLWGRPATGTGRLLQRQPAREILAADKVPKDFAGLAGLDYIHRRAGSADIYFVASSKADRVGGDCQFRVSGKLPELWDPVQGTIRALPQFKAAGGVTTVPLEFAPYGSLFIVFRPRGAAAPVAAPAVNFQPLAVKHTVAGPWQVNFDAAQGGVGMVEFPALIDWAKDTRAGVRFFSGTAVYQNTFSAPAMTGPVYLDLGSLRELAEVRLNGRPLGVVWAPPYRVDVTGVLRPGPNQLTIEVVNFWPNRLIGDSALPVDQRRTKTNIKAFKPDTPLMASGLFGPVTLMQAE